MDPAASHPAAPARTPVTGALVFTGLGVVAFGMAVAGLVGYDVDLVGSDLDNAAAQNVMLCLGLVFMAGSLTSFFVALFLRLLGR